MSAQSKLEIFRSAREKLMGDTPARKRLASLMDPGTFVEVDGLAVAGEEPCGVVCGYGSIGGGPVYAFAQDATEHGGAVGRMHAAKIAKVYDLALKTGVPVVGIYDSSGARLLEGAGALSAYGELLLHASNLSGVVPQIALVLGTCAGTSAMMACSADFVVMSADAAFFMTPPSLSKDKVEGAGTAENAAKAGVAHILAADEQAAIAQVRKLVPLLPLNNLVPPPVGEGADPAAELLADAARDFEGVAGADIAKAVCDADSATELLADYGPAAYTALATMGGTTCGLVAVTGKLDADSCAKIAKVVGVCDAFQVPVITFVNSTGFEPSAKAELSGAVREMAKMAHVYAEATTPKIAVVTARAYGAVYVALASRAANSDYTLAWPTAMITALAPEASVEFLYADQITAENSRQSMVQQYEDEKASALNAAQGGYIDDVIEPAETRERILSAMELLGAKRVSRNPKKHSNIPM